MLGRRCRGSYSRLLDGIATVSGRTRLACTMRRWLLLPAVLALAACQLLSPERLLAPQRGDFLVIIQNDRASPIIVRLLQPEDQAAAWLLDPDQFGPAKYAMAGSDVIVFTESCDEIGRIVLPTHSFSDEASYHVRPDGQIVEETIDGSFMPQQVSPQRDCPVPSPGPG